MRSQEAIMNEGGYVTATAAATAIGADQIGTVHRMIRRGELKGARAGKHWYVSVQSLLDAHKEAPPIVARILALGVEPKEEEPAKTASKGGARGRRAQAAR